MKHLTCIIMIAVVAAVGNSMCAATIEPGHELPMFGNRVTENPLDLNARWARISEWYHPCVERTPIREVSKTEKIKWLQKRINYRQMGVDNKASERREYLRKLEKLVVEICAEFYRYNVRYDSSKPIGIINSFYNTNNYHWYWEGSYEPICMEFREILKWCDSCMDRLDKVHQKEYELWARNNPEEWEMRNNAKTERERQEAVTRKFQDLEDQNRQAQQRAIAAEKRAADAEIAAEWAQQRAADAESRAAFAEIQARNAQDAAARANSAASWAQHEATWSKWR